MNAIVENLISKIQRLRCAPLEDHEKCMGIRNWLADDVAPLVYGFADDGRFVDAANWPIANLAPSSSSKLRSTLDKLRGQLKNFASLAERRTALHGSSSSSIASDPNFAAAGKTLAAKTSDPGAETSPLAIPWAYPNDYWEPVAMPYDADFKQTGLSLLGDRVTRACLARIESCLKTLGYIETRVEFPRTSDENAVQSFPDEVVSTAQEIRDQCLSRLNGFGEACVVLTQVYAAFARRVDLHWIESKDPLVNTTQDAPIAKTIVGTAIDEDALDRIVWAISTVANELEQLPDPDLVFQHAVSRFKLVVDLSTKSFFWKGEEFKEDLSPSNWELFALLSEARKFSNRPVEHLDLRCKNGSLKVLKVQKLRLASSLKKQFPDLAKAIKSCGRSYELSIDRDQIEIFTRKTAESIYRLCGQSQTIPYAMAVRH